MLRLDKIVKPRKDIAALNAHVNLYGSWSETTFLTKCGDVGMILRVPCVDYESLDHTEQEYAVKRLDAALKSFGPSFHVYQYLFNSNRPEIPFAAYDDPVVEAAIDQRRKFSEAKGDHLYQVEIADFATIPGNSALNLHKLCLLNTNSADLSFLFTLPPGEKTNMHLSTEYLAVFETDNSTPYSLNLHNGEVAHTLFPLPLR